MSGVPVITIDGPGGSGKGTVGRQLAQRLGWAFLDSGALYRVTALAAIDQGLDLADQSAIASLIPSLDIAFGSGDSVLLGGEEVGDRLRTEQAGNAASKVAAHPTVRAALLQWQRDFRRPPGIVADGRDMGTVVFPDAGVKVFLTASVEERARRRYKQLIEKGLDANISALSDEIAERDARDTQRAAAPLRAAADALVLDSTAMSIDEVVERILAEAERILRC
ncbi:MAG: (d)CMP kinase [Chromatiales bacterium]|nr:(d)CMP kinase [Chromatiales bacterium]